MATDLPPIVQLKDKMLFDQVQLEGFVQAGARAERLAEALRGMDDPEQKAEVWERHAKEVQAMGLQLHAELAKWTLEGEKLLPMIIKNGQIAGAILSPAPPTARIH